MSESAASFRGIDHVGVTVPDIEEATDYFVRAFGARVVLETLPAGAPATAGSAAERRLGLPAGAAVVRKRHLRLGEGPSVELFQLAETAQRAAALVSDLGLQHVALYVDDLEEALRRVRDAGGVALSGIADLPEPEDGAGNRFVYTRAPWGMLVELLTYPSGMRYGEESEVTRWTPPG